MALVDMPAMWMPDPFYGPGAAAPSYQSFLLDAAADRIAVVFRAPKAGDIHKVGFLIGAVPALNALSTITIALQNVSLTNGDPDGTDDQSVDIAAASVTADTMLLGTLTADRTVTKGELLAAVIRYGTFTAADQVNVKMVTATSKYGSATNIEYVDNNLTGSYGHNGAVLPILEIEYVDGSHAYSATLQYPFATIASDTYANNSDPDERALLFQVPVPCRLAGAWMLADLDGDAAFNFYTSAAKTQVGTMDKDVRFGTGPGCLVMSRFASPQTLAAATTYALSVEPTTTTSLILYHTTVSAVAVWDQTVGGQSWHYGAAKDPTTTASFTATTTKRPIMGLIFDQFDDGTSTGGGVIGGPNKRGGKQ